MKKLISILLVLTILLSLAACGGDPAATTVATTEPPTTEKPSVFMAGYCKMDITPEGQGYPMMGYSNDDARLSEGMYTYLYATTLVVQDIYESRAMIISVDSGSVQTAICDRLRKQISQECDIPVENIMFTSIHQHSTPSFASKQHATAGQYASFFEKRVLESAKKAMEDLAPAELSIATVETEGLTFVRHYLMNDGTYAGDGYGSFSSGIQAHESEADNDLQLVKFDREGQTTVGGKEAKNILLSNFQGHPHSGTDSQNKNLSADVPGIYREEVEAATGYHTMYVSGSQGNLNMTSRIQEENAYSTFQERGKALADYAIKAINDDIFTPVNTGKVQGAVVIYEGKADHSMDHLLQEAIAIDAAWKATYNATEAMSKATSGQIHTHHHATAIIAKAAEGETKTMPVIAISFGDVAICGGQYEMFDTNGMEIKAQSPFQMTFTAHMANGSQGYVPSAMSYQNGCYSADITRYAPGSGEELRDLFVHMLRDQRDSQ